jgi:hypothetical protein
VSAWKGSAGSNSQRQQAREYIEQGGQLKGYDPAK